MTSEKKLIQCYPKAGVICIQWIIELVHWNPLDSPKLSGSIKQAYDKINYNPGRDGLITTNINAATGVKVASNP